MAKPKHPDQPLVIDKLGVVRFKANAIIEWLFMDGKLDLNQIAAYVQTRRFSVEDQRQLMQLIGYSVSGYGGLSFVTNKETRRHDEAVDALLASRKPPRKEPL